MRQQTPALRIERLEDRTTPSTFAEPVPARAIVAFADAAIDAAARVASLRQQPFTDAVTPLGFGLYRVDLHAGTPAESAAVLFAAMPDVVAAAPDRIVQVQSTLNDPRLSEQSGLEAIGAAAAWNRTTGTRSTIVAVIDTGLDYTHPDLAPNLWVNPREVAGNGRDDDGNGYIDDVIGYDFAANDADPADHDGHGTHVAGILGAVGNNGLGISGVNPNVRIMPLKFIGTDGNGYTSDAIRAVNYALANGARVVNASWGSNVYDPVFATALARAQAAGLILVTSAGNDSANNDTVAFYPASYAATLENVVTVAATDAAGNLAGFSNYGVTTVALAAPGTGILSTLPGNRYGELSGTSMAAPFVAGALALLWDANPAWSWLDVVRKLKSSVDPLPALAGRVATGGRLNVARMLDVPVPVAPPIVPPPPVTVPAPARETDGARVTSAIFHGTAPGQFDRVRIAFNEKINAGSFTTVDVTLEGPKGAFAATAVTPVGGTNGTQFDIAFPPQTIPGSYHVTLGVDVFDIAANRMNQNGNGVNGEPDDRFTGSGTLGAATTTATSGLALPIAIPDAGRLEIPIVVGQDGTVAAIVVKVAIDHARVGDLVLRLRAPNGRIITLVEHRGGAGAGFDDTTFDDSAARLISKVPAPFAGSFRPEEALAGFAGQPARGTWTLLVEDHAVGNRGRVAEVGLVVATTNVLAGSVRTLAFADGTALRTETQAILGLDPALTEPVSVDGLLAWALEQAKVRRGPFDAAPTL